MPSRAPISPVSWEGLSAVSFGILLHPFSASIFSQKVFRGSKITRVFLQPFCNREVGNPTGAWQAGHHQRAHGEDIRLKSSASASEWHEYRGPRNPLILQDVSASFGGLGVIRRIWPDIESLRSERTTNKTTHFGDAPQRRWSLFEFRDLSHKRPTTTSLLPSRTHLRR